MIIGADRIHIEGNPGIEVLETDIANIAGLGAGTAALTPASVTVGGGTPVTKIAVYSPALTPAAVAANTTAEQTFTVTGLATNDKVFVNKPTAQAGLGIVGMRVSAANTLAITFSNNTAASITPAAGETYQVVAMRS